MRRALAVLTPVVMWAGCLSARADVDVAALAGDWQGRIVTARGHTGARLTLTADGRYEGTAFFDDAERPLRGAIVALPSGRLRYVGNEGDGAVEVDEGVLRFRGDDGATGGRFRRAEHP